jgi:hypothetical protein
MADRPAASLFCGPSPSFKIRTVADDEPVVSFLSSPKYLIAGSAAAAGAAVAINGIGQGPTGFSAMATVRLVVGLVLGAFGIYALVRATRRRSRAESLSWARRQWRGRRGWIVGADHDGADHPDRMFLDPDADLDPMFDFDRRERRFTHADLNEALGEALAVSLEEELHADLVWGRRSQRTPAWPGCRRARLRAAGRPAPVRKRLGSRARSSSSN